MMVGWGRRSPGLPLVVVRVLWTASWVRTDGKLSCASTAEGRGNDGRRFGCGVAAAVAGGGYPWSVFLSMIDRLREFRAVDDPHERLSFEEVLSSDLVELT